MLEMRCSRHVAVACVSVVCLLVAATSALLIQSPLPGVDDEVVRDARESLLAKTKGNASLPPLIFVPGLTSSAIDAELHNSPSIYGCLATTEGRVPVWPPQINSTRDYLCFLDNVKLYFDPIKQTFHNKPGEKTFVQDYGGFGGLPGFDFVSQPLVDAGYIIGQNLFAVPFDWRGPAVAFPQFFSNLTRLVEHAYEINGQRKVSIAAVSYGPQFVLSFLHRQPQAWKDKYINWFVAESPVWSGSPAAMLAVISGYDATSKPQLLFTREVSIETMSDFWLFPRHGNTNNTWSTNEVLASTPSRNYTSGNYDQLLTDLGFGFKVPALKHVMDDLDLKDFKHPGVNTFVAYGYGIGTPGRFEWDEDFVHNITGAPPFPRIINATDTGDSIVTLRSSLRGWNEWRAPMQQAGKTLAYKGYRNQNHGYCIAPTKNDNCWLEVLNLVNDGAIPPGAHKS